MESRLNAETGSESTVMPDWRSRDNQTLADENQAMRRKLSAMELSNRTLNENLLAKQFEIRELEARIEELKLLYDNSVSARKDYDKYFDTVGQVYSVACESADSIVNRAEKNAMEIISDLETKTKQARENSEKALLLVRKMREGLSESLPNLIRSLQNAYEEVDAFYTSLESVPQSFGSILSAQQLSFLDIKNELEEYHARSRSIMAAAQQSGGEAHTYDDREPAAEPAVDGNSDAAAEAEAFNSPTEFETVYPERTAFRAVSRITPSEPEAIPPRQETEAPGKLHTGIAPDHFAIAEDKAVADKVSRAEEETQSPPVSRRRRTNVKDLLDKYKNHQL